ncbi:MAG: RDD family protein [Actinomycetota bacterium]|nr:MAG: RDD family protein [Actinomycetota bacterium]
MAGPWDYSSSSHLGDGNEPQVNGPRTYPLATFGQRAFAWLIDLLIMAAIGEALVHINPRLGNDLSALVNLGYMVILLGGPYGQTVGAKVARVRVINLDGKQLGYWRATARYLVSGLSALILGLGYLWMLKDARRQTLHDKVAGSLVISLAHSDALEAAG